MDISRLTKAKIIAKHILKTPVYGASEVSDMFLGSNRISRAMRVGLLMASAAGGAIGFIGGSILFATGITMAPNLLIATGIGAAAIIPALVVCVGAIGAYQSCTGGIAYDLDKLHQKQEQTAAPAAPAPVNTPAPVTAPLADTFGKAQSPEAAKKTEIEQPKPPVL